MSDHMHDWRAEDVTGPMCHFACDCGATLHPAHAVRRLNATEELSAEAALYAGVEVHSNNPVSDALFAYAAALEGNDKPS